MLPIRPCSVSVRRKRCLCDDECISGDKLLESKTLNLSDTIVRFEYPYRESYGDGVFVNLCMVRDGQVYQEQVRLTKRIPDKTLTMKWEVFRDKLRPGQRKNGS